MASSPSSRSRWPRFSLRDEGDRKVVLFVAGLVLTVASWTAFTAAGRTPDPTLTLVFAGMMGLALVLPGRAP